MLSCGFYHTLVLDPTVSAHKRLLRNLAGFYAGGVKQRRGSLRELCEFRFTCYLRNGTILPPSYYREYGHMQYDDDDSKSYVRPLLQLETVTSVLVIRPGKQFSFQITTERKCKQ